MADIIQQRRDTAARWKQYNPILLEGEVGYVTDNPNQYKIGDGKTPWNSLPLRGYTGTITQDTGSDENAVMSQKAVTEKFSELGSYVNTFNVSTYDINASTPTIVEAASVVPQKYRKRGLNVIFRNSRGYNVYQYIGTATQIIESYWLDSSYWKDVTPIVSSTKTNSNIKGLFVSGYLSYSRDIESLENLVTMDNSFICVLLKVSVGDIVSCSNIVGGSSKARAFVKYDEFGKVMSYAESGVIINGSIEIDYNGYLGLNHEKRNDFECEASVLISNMLSSFYVVALNNHVEDLTNSVDALSNTIDGLIADVAGFDKGLTDNEELNKLLEELAIPESVDPSDIVRITISDCYKYSENSYYNTVRYKLKSTGLNYDIYSKSFKTLEEAAADVGVDGRVIGEEKDGVNGYALFRSIGMNGQKNYTNFTFLKSPSLLNSSKISAFLNKQRVAKVEKRVDKIESQSDISEKNFKILCFGNSFTQDSMGYVPFILKNVAPNLNITLAIAYIGGCPLVQHCVNLTGESMMLDSSQYDLRDYNLQLYNEEQGAWASKGSMNADTILAYDDWDIITFQQNGTNSDADWATYYEPYIYKIHKAIAEKVSKPIKLGWLSVHGSYKKTFEDLYNKWEGTVENSQKIQNLTGNQIIFPFGTAVQNLRTTPLVNLGDGGFLMGDTAHLHDGIGCLAAAYANALKILEVSGYDIHSIIGEKTRPTKEWISEKGIPSPNYGAVTNDVVGITEDNCYTAQIAAIMAVKKPYEVTDCSKFYKEQYPAK